MKRAQQGQSEQRGCGSVTLFDHIKTLIGHERELRQGDKDEYRRELAKAEATLKEKLHEMNQIREHFFSKDEHVLYAKEQKTALDAMQRLLYIGVGIVLAVQFLIGVFVTVWEIARK